MEVLFAIFFILHFVSHCSCNKLQVAAKNTNTFNVMDYGAIGDGLTDDSQVFLKVWSMVCGMENGAATLEVPSGKTFMLNPLQFKGPCKFSTVNFQLDGDIVAPNSTKPWEGESEDSSRWIDFSDIDGLVVNGGGQIDGRGSLWWTSCEDKSCPRPTALFFHNCNNLQLHGTHHVNSARNHISINSSNHTHVFDVTITAPEDSPNTDGIDISRSNYALIERSTIATGDDCIAMNGGTSNINITAVTCGPGHGISVGSLGEGGSVDTVEEVYVNNCTFKGTDNGMRIKTWQGGRGYARNIKFEQIILINSKNPIIINQDYQDIMSEGKNEESEVEISGVTYRDVSGTSDSETAITFNCGSGKGCTDLSLDTINITATSGSNLQASCNNAHGYADSTSPSVPCLSQQS